MQLKQKAWYCKETKLMMHLFMKNWKKVKTKEITSTASVGGKLHKDGHTKINGIYPKHFFSLLK